MTTLRLVDAPASVLILVTALGLLAAGCASQGEKAKPPAQAGFPALAEGVDAARLERRVADFVPISLDFDEGILDPTERRIVRLLVEASREMDEIYLTQVSGRAPGWRATLEGWQAPEAGPARAFFGLMVGPWDRLDHDRPMLAVGPKPLGAGLYPDDMTRDEFESWVKAHPDQKEALEGYFTVVRRADTGGLTAVPYSEAYGASLESAAGKLREASKLTPDPRLRRYLETRAAAFLGNDYFESDLAWMDLGDGKIEVVIGPYEVYEDRLFSYKAAFESFVAVRDPKASADLARLASRLPSLEKSLPIEDRYKNDQRGAESPISVVDEVYVGGQARGGVQTAAFNLPNDERVRAAKGTKKVMLRNVMRAKFENALVPIARAVLDPAQLDLVNFDAFFTHVLMHEMAHGLGPGFIVLPDGSKTDVNRALKDLYSPIEEAKADVLGMWSIPELVARGEFPPDFEAKVYASFLGGIFRSIRFGASDAHGRANVVIYNYLRGKGAYAYDAASGKLHLDLARVKPAVSDLARELLTLQGEGSYPKAQAMLDTYGAVTPEITGLIDCLRDVPVDIAPQFKVVEKMAAW